MTTPVCPAAALGSGLHRVRGPFALRPPAFCAPAPPAAAMIAWTAAASLPPGCPPWVEWGSRGEKLLAPNRPALAAAPMCGGAQAAACPPLLPPHRLLRRPPSAASAGKAADAGGAEETEEAG